MKQIRHCTGGTYAITDTLATTQEIAIGGADSGEIFIPALSLITTLTFHVALAEGGTFLPAYTSAGAAVTQAVVAEQSHPIPSAVFGAATMKIVVDVDGDVDICLKS